MKNCFYILFLLVLFSCDDTLFNAGDVITKNFEIEDFKEIYVNDIFEIQLIQDTVCKIEAQGGSNLLANLKFTVVDKKLTIDDDNTASWSRNYDKIKLFISVDTLKWFELEAPSFVTCKDTLLTPQIYILSIDDYSEINLKLKCGYCYFVNSGTSGGKINISGQTNIFSFWARASYQVDASNFIANSVTAKSESIADCEIYANESIKVEILNEGNVYYKGEPETIEYVNERAKNQLIKQN